MITGILAKISLGTGIWAKFRLGTGIWHPPSRPSLLYADDLIILSRSKTGPQNCLDKLSSFCTSWIMKINPKINLVDSQIIDVEQEYTYLGTRMSSSGNFSVSREHLKEKALHALFSLRRHTNLSKLKAALACKIFDTMISPILTYNLKFGVCMPNQILRQCAHICLAPSQN